MTNLETKIIAHHVGGRGFNVAFSPPIHFKADIVHVLFEADSGCADEMNRNSHTHQANLLGEMYLLPFCLGRLNGRGRLNITANAHASSLLSPDPSFFNNYCELQIGPAIYDVTYDDMLEVVKSVDVDVYSLDQLFEQNKLPVKALPDVLSMDTQGLEYDIMHGAKRVIRDSVLAIVTEVELVSMYQGQPLLGDVLQLMNAYGFHFGGFTKLHEVSQYRAPVGLRGKAFPGFGDALFIRKIETFDSMGLSKSELFLKATKLAFISLVFSHVEYALKSLQLATSLRHEVQSDILERLEARTYCRFLQQVETVVGQVEQVYPPIFPMPSSAGGDGCSYPAPSWYDSQDKEMVAKFHKESMLSTSRPITWLDRFYAHLKYLLVVGSAYSSVRIKDLIFTRPHKAAAKILYHSIVYARQRFPVLIHAASSLVIAARESSQRVIVAPQVEEGYSSFESLLIHYGFEMVADTVREKRITAERFVRSQRK